MEGIKMKIKKYIKMYKVERDSAGNSMLYKAVRDDYGSWYNYSSWYHRRSKGFFDGFKVGAYRPGTLVINSRGTTTDRRKACGEGLHVGILDCAVEFASRWISDPRIIQVSVNPYDVGCVPCHALEEHLDNQIKKIRVKKLIVVKDITKRALK
jgi:hypothetical protein